MSPLKATLYYNTILTNPDSPKENIDLVMQYRQKNLQKFFSDEQMRSQRNTGVQSAERGFEGGYRRRGRNYDSDGFSYDQYGNRYDNRGNSTDGFSDGGSERFQGNWSPYGFSEYYGVLNQRPRRSFGPRKPISEARSPQEVKSTVRGLRSTWPGSSTSTRSSSTSSSRAMCFRIPQ